jgi:hypothetical protein
MVARRAWLLETALPIVNASVFFFFRIKFASFNVSFLLKLSKKNYPRILGDDNNKFENPGRTGLFVQCNCVVRRAATEACDGLDNDCDGVVDNGVWIDRDNDGFSAPGSAFECIANRLKGDATKFATDCNDDPARGGAAIFPGATEIVCDAIDQNCDGDDIAFHFVDKDNDTYLINTTPLTPAEEAACRANGLNVFDCDDTRANVHPGLREIDFRAVKPNFDFGDDLDNDCNGIVDDIIRDAIRLRLSGQIINLDAQRKRTVFVDESASSSSSSSSSSSDSCVNVIVELELTNLSNNEARNVIIQGKILLPHDSHFEQTVLGELGRYGFKVDAKTGAVTWVQFRLGRRDPANVTNRQTIQLPICAENPSGPTTVHLAVVRTEQLDFDLQPARLELKQ